MRAVVQRVSMAEVDGGEGRYSRIGKGLLVLLGVEQGDESRDAEKLASKIAGLRIFSDQAGQMNLDLAAVSGEIMVISQFTLLADCSKGRRPSFARAATPAEANRLYQVFVKHLAGLGFKVATGYFRTEMQVSLVNDGPVTMLLDTRY